MPVSRSQPGSAALGHDVLRERRLQRSFVSEGQAVRTGREQCSPAGREMLALLNYFPPFTFVIIIICCQPLLQMPHCGTMTVVKRAGHPFTISIGHFH